MQGYAIDSVLCIIPWKECKLNRSKKRRKKRKYATSRDLNNKRIAEENIFTIYELLKKF